MHAEVGTSVNQKSQLTDLVHDEEVAGGYNCRRVPPLTSVTLVFLMAENTF
jgi:hypothetical protein